MKSNWVNNSISNSLNRYEYMILTNHYIMGRKNIKKKKKTNLPLCIRFMEKEINEAKILPQ